MNTLTQDDGFDIKALIAVLFAVVLIGLLAVALANAGPSQSADANFTEPGLPQGAIYPQTGDKFAPGRIIQQDDLEIESGNLTPCHGEGLLDRENYDRLAECRWISCRVLQPQREVRGRTGCDARSPALPAGRRAHNFGQRLLALPADAGQPGLPCVPATEMT